MVDWAFGRKQTNLQAGDVMVSTRFTFLQAGLRHMFAPPAVSPCAARLPARECNVSSVLLCAWCGCSLTDDGDVDTCMLTEDHNGMNKGEAERIEDAYSHVAAISDDRGYLSIRGGMWAGYELSVTRALGHKNLSAYGVLCEPTVNTLQLRSDDACLVRALTDRLVLLMWAVLGMGIIQLGSARFAIHTHKPVVPVCEYGGYLATTITTFLLPCACVFRLCLCRLWPVMACGT